MNWFRAVVGVQLLFWVLVGFGVYHYGPTVAQGIENLFHGVTARIDHSIGFPAKGGS